MPDGAHHHEDVVVGVKTDALTLERLKVKSAILTDFILSAEIMALTLSEVATLSFTTQVGVLVVVGLLITVLVYGVVGLIVRIDDVGVAMTKTSYPVLKTVGRSLVLGMPYFLQVLGVVGTAAMLWVGGSILIHTLAQIGFEAPEHVIHQAASSISHLIGFLPEIVDWTVTSALQALVAIVVGAVLIVLIGTVIAPVIGMFRKSKA
jgi:predicted DNA repair protein MutK